MLEINDTSMALKLTIKFWPKGLRLSTFSLLHDFLTNTIPAMTHAAFLFIQATDMFSFIFMLLIELQGWDM